MATQGIIEIAESETVAENTVENVVDTVTDNTVDNNNLPITDITDGPTTELTTTPVTEPHVDQPKTTTELPETTVEVTIKLNKSLSEVPKKYQRFRHGSHRHRLFVGFGMEGHLCDNKTCRKKLTRVDTRFFCQRCDYDLCAQCFAFAPAVEVELDKSDNDVDDNIMPELFKVITKK